MKNRFLNFISSANQVILFIAAIVVLSITLFNVVDLLFIHEETSPGVQISSDAEPESESKVTVYTKKFNRRINDVLIFMIESDTINLNAKHRTGFIEKRSVAFMPPHGSGYYYGSDNTVNIMFFTEGSPCYVLFKNDRLIKEVEFAHTDEKQNWELELSKNLYLVVDADSNEDGFLGDGDKSNLYSSDYNGKNVKLVFENVSQFEVIEDNKVLITEGEKQFKKFYIYNVQTEELQLLDTKI